MKLVKSILLFSALLVTACSNGGGGDDDKSSSQTTSSAEKIPTTDSAIPATTDNNAQSALGSRATLGSISGFVYTTPDNFKYDLLADGTPSGGPVIISDRHGTISYCCDKLGYSEYGTWSSRDETQRSVFYAGLSTAANEVPTQGSATYKGSALRGQESSAANFNVDFAAKKIKGDIVAGDKFGEAVAMQGNIINGGFKGDAQTGRDKGTFVGHFNGSEAEELSGIAQFADTTKSTAFGAARQ